MTRHPALGHPPLSRPPTSLLKRLVCALTLLSASAKAAVVTATWNAASDTPVTASSYTATGNTVSFALNFAPQTRMDLMVVKNTGLPFIQGRFSNLAQGQAVALSFGGTTYNYVANYYGGSGNDLVLQSADVVLAAWGNNGNGQLGNGSLTQSLLPVAVTSTGVLAGKTVISVAAGNSHSLALCSDGTVAAWGSNYYGELGNGNTGLSYSSVPVAVTRTGVLAGKTVISVAAGSDHSLALCSDGTVAAWGLNEFGRLGNGNTLDSSLPVAVTRTGVLAGKTVIAVAAGGEHNLALCSDGTVAAWGYNFDGRLGNGTKLDSSLPVAVTSTGVLAGKTVVSVAVGAHSLALCSDGTVAAWGRNDLGQLGNGNTLDSSVPVAVTSTGVLAGKTVTSVAAGYVHSLALCSDGTLAAWGRNASGQLGNGNTLQSSLPVAVTSAGVLAGKTLLSVAAGYSHSLAVCSDGTVAAWGENVYGQLGNGNTLQSLLPVSASTNSSYLATRAVGGAFHSLSLGSFVPIVATLAAAPVGTTLNGTVNANGYSSAVSFDYGLTTSYGSTVAGTPSPVTGSTPTAVSAVPPGLTPSTTYHFRVKAVSSGGTSVGSDLTFTTPSNNANLAGLALSTGTLAPTFASGTTGYTVSVPNATTSLTVTPTTADAGATVKVNGTSVASGSASGSISLAVGNNTLNTVVTAADGTTTKTYTISVTRLPLPPTVTSPTSTAVTTNSATLGGTVTSDGGAAVTARGVVLALTAANANPQLGGTGVTNVSGTGTTGVFTVGAGTLASGSGYSYTAYASNSAGTSYSSTGTFTTLSTDANLAGLALSSGTLAPTFASGTTGYTFSVPNATTSLIVTPTAADTGATVKVNGTSVAAGSASGAISLGVGGDTLTILVTAADGTTIKTYTIVVTRPPTVTSPTSTEVTTNSATLGGNVTGDGGAAVTARGVVLALTAANANPQLGGTGVTNVSGTGTTGVFTVGAGPLTPSSSYSYAAYATNNLGTSYSSTGTFTTASITDASLAGLALSAGTLAPSFASATIGYTASVPNTITSLMVTPTVSVFGATVKVNGTSVASGSASAAISLAVGTNTISTVVTAADGTTTKTYTVTVTRRAVVAVVATYSAATDVPLTVNGYEATGNTVSFALNFAPQTRMDLMVVKNTGLSFIQGRFSNLAQGQAVALSFGGTTYNYVANYYGGSGNDLVLHSADVVLATWGRNDSGQLGNGNTTDSSVSVAVTSTGLLAGKTVISVAAGTYHSLALCSDGTVAAWGLNGNYELGNGNQQDSSLPVAVTSTGVLAGKTVVSVAAGGEHSLALCSDGTVAAWGSNFVGQLGNGTNLQSSEPVAVISTGVLAGKTVIAVAAGNHHSLALCSDGTVAAWGLNNSGQLGNGNKLTSSEPVAVTSTGVLAGKTVISVAGGYAHSLALCSDGTVAAWGYSGYGQLGNGSGTESSLPVAVTGT